MGDTLTKKELIDIGGRPLLWHVMRLFSAAGHDRFLLALGHLGDQVRRYFLEYEAMTRDTTIRIATSNPDQENADLHFASPPDHAPWTVTMVDTGLTTEKASRIGQLRPHLAEADTFIVAYGEAVADIDLGDLLQFHRSHGKSATVTGIQVDFQYGVIDVDAQQVVTGFAEKPRLPYWINGGFMVFERSVLDRIEPNRDDVHLENEVLPRLAGDDELMLYKHKGYWQSMKTLKDALKLKKDWHTNAPWRTW